VNRPPLCVATPPVTPYTKGALYTSALNCFGMFVMTLHYVQHLKLAPVS